MASSNVVDFPETMLTLWQPHERQLREFMGRAGHLSEEQITVVLDRLRPIYVRHAGRAGRHPHHADQGNDPLTRVQAYVFQLTCGLLLEIAQRQQRLGALGEIDDCMPEPFGWKG